MRYIRETSRRGSGTDVILTLTGMQLSYGLEPELLELVTEAKCQKRNGSFSITFSEALAGELDSSTTTTLNVSSCGEKVTLMRFGAVNNHFVFEKGKKHLSHYETDLGSFTIGVTAKDMDVSMDERRGDIHIGYEIEVEGGDTIFSDIIVNMRSASH